MEIDTTNSEYELQDQDENSGGPKHLQPWQFKKGQSGNPNGRPPGKSLKERAKAMLNAMTPEEEQAFLEGIDKKTIWEMAEGKAKQDIDSNVKATINVIVPPQVAAAFNIDGTHPETSGGNTE